MGGEDSRSTSANFCHKTPPTQTNQDDGDGDDDDSTLQCEHTPIFIMSQSQISIEGGRIRKWCMI